MDEIARYNRDRWKALAQANALYTRLRFDMDVQKALALIDSAAPLGDVSGKRVLCLASGGGWQSVAFGLLGAEVTVVDLSAEQLERDRQAAQHYNLHLTLQQGDMRDLSMLAEQVFDIVHQAYSLNFVPDAEAVFREVRRVIKPNGVYDLMCANPFAAGMGTQNWNGTGYTVKAAYVQGQRIEYEDEAWVYDRQQHAAIASPVEYRQTLSKLVNGLVANGFVIRCLKETTGHEVTNEAEPGTWEHFSAVLPPWLWIRANYRPDVIEPR